MDNTAILITASCAGVLALLLAGAVWHDVRSRRIPNKLVLAGMLAGLALHTLLPTGAGFFSPDPGGLGLLGSLAGLGLGFGLLLPAWLLRAMGAGDVKLMAMVGAFLGAEGALAAVLLTMVAGGVMAIAAALWSGALTQVLANVRFMLTHSMIKAMSGSGVSLEAPAVATGRLPYAVAIATGTLAQILLNRFGVGPFAS